MSNTSLRAYSINNADEFSNYLETLDNTDGLVYSGNGKIVIESECAPAMMLAESLAEFGIVTPLMEADDLEETLREEEEARELEEKKKAQAAAQENQGNDQPKEGEGQPAQEQKPEEKKEEAPAQEQKTEEQQPEQKEEAPAEKGEGEGNLDEVSSPSEEGGQEQAAGEESQGQEGDSGESAEGAEPGADETAGGEDAGSEQEQETEKPRRNGIPEVTELPEAFRVEPDDSEWDNAVVTGYGFPMVNFSSQLVQDMLRAADPKSQKRSYKEFKKQLKKNPDIANALGMGLGGTLGLRSGKEGAKTNKKAAIQTDSNNSEADVLVEGPIDSIAKAMSNPIELLKRIAKPKGAPCKRNLLVVNHNEIADKSGDSDDDVEVIPLGVSGGTLVKMNKTVNVPVVHLTTFYSVVDPNASYKSYVKAMAEVNEKAVNAGMSNLDALKSAAKNLKSKIPLLGRKAKQEIEAKQKEGVAAAMEQLSNYIEEHGHPPFYLLKARSKPKEQDRWADEDAAHGYQMIAVNVGGRKAGMFLKKSTAEALFHVG